jgi:hypothetical protein
MVETRVNAVATEEAIKERGASLRFSLVNAILAKNDEHGSVTVGLAEP